MNTPPPASRLILLGLDGATFANLKPWAEEGILPNFRRIMGEGAWGPLASTIPPTTPPAWTAAITGKNPGKHGIFDFRDSPYRDFERPLITGASIRGRKIWNILNEHGLRCGVLNVPITWPPEKINGFMLSGMMTPGAQSEWAEPAVLKEEINQISGGYFPDLDIAKFDAFLDRDALDFLRAVEDCCERRRKAFLHLLDTKPWEFFMAVFILPDRIQHLFWKFIDPAFNLYRSPQAQRLREPILRCYRAMDAMLGQVLERLDARTDLMILSDHGFGGTETWFNVNEWLRSLGLLAKNPHGALRKKMFYQAMVLNESKLVRALIPDAIQSAIRRKIRAGRDSIRASVRGEIDWTKTKAYFSGVASQGIYLNATNEEERLTLQQKIKDKLLELRDPHTNECVVDEVWFREDIYQGPQTKFAPDIFFKARNYGVLGRALFGDNKALRSSEATPNGFHRPDGILLAIGERFQRGAGPVQGAQIADITPTVLHAMGFPVPDDMDGQVLLQLFHGEYKKREIQFVKAPEDEQSNVIQHTFAEEEQIRQRLKGLGYLE